MPASLSEAAQAEWNRLAPELYALGCLTNLDAAAFARYCQAFADWNEANEGIKKHGGPVVKGTTGAPIQNPYIRIRNAAAQQMIAAGAELGLSPAGRSRIKVTPAAKDAAEDPIAAFFAGKGA